MPPYEKDAQKTILDFVSEEQESGMLGSFDQMLAKANEIPDEMPLPPPDWYTVDAIVFNLRMFGHSKDGK